MLLGYIADDLTGATDLAIMLTRAGMRTLQVMQVPEAPGSLEGFDAVVIALKTRTCPVEEAVRLSLASADALLSHGARQIFFKYCSTFDSTDQGNIGPVADALLDRLEDPLALVCPAFPTNKRTIYMGNLYVGEVPLAESAMRDHPLTPMRDSNLVRLLQRQTRSKVGLLAFPIVNRGSDAIGAALATAQQLGQRFIVVDAITDDHLLAIGKAAAHHKLVTGGSGVALGLPANFIAAGLMRLAEAPRTIAAPKGRAAVIAGSCSEATRAQVAAAKSAGIPAFEVDPLQIETGAHVGPRLAIWAKAQPANRPVLIYSSADPASVARTQETLGRDRAGAIIERALADAAEELVAGGFSRLIVAGGETAGAVVNRLSVTALEIGPEIDPGVPWTQAVGRDLVLALKSGNFGAPDFFIKAWGKLT